MSIDTVNGMSNHTEKRNSMTNGYFRLYANEQLNSHIESDVQCKGTTINSYLYTVPPRCESITAFFLNNDRIVINLSKSILFFNPQQQGKYDSRSIQTGSPVVIDKAGIVYYDNRVLYRSIKGSFPDKNDYAQFSGFPGDYSQLMALYPSESSFIECVHRTNTPQSARNKTFIACTPYAKGSKYKWALEFQGQIPLPPITPSGHLVVIEKNILNMIDITNGLKANSAEIDYPVKFCSVDKENNMYLLQEKEFGSVIQKRSLSLKQIWKHDIDIRKTVQPAIVSDDGTVYVTGLMRIVAVNQNGVMWEQVRKGGQDDFYCATITRNGMLLVADGSYLYCIDKSGTIAWSISHPANKNFSTQPFCDTKGHVWVADDQAIYEIE